MTVFHIERVEEQETVKKLEPGTLLRLGQERELRGALVTDSNTAYYVQSGDFGLVVPIVGPDINRYPGFDGRLRWRKNKTGESFEKSNVDPTLLAFRPK